MSWERVLAAADGLPGVVEAPSQFGDVPALWVTGVEFAHLESPVQLSVRVGRKWAGSADAGVLGGLLSKRNATSEWFLLSGEASDEELRLALAQGAEFSRRQGFEGPPAPAEARLARRRKFHTG